jgi:hypothetical protein
LALQKWPGGVGILAEEALPRHILAFAVFVRRPEERLTMRLRFVVPVALELFPAVAFSQTIRDSTVSVSAARTNRIAPDRASMYVLERDRPKRRRTR